MTTSEESGKKKQSLVQLIFQSMGALLNQRQWNEIWVLSNLKIRRKEIMLSVLALFHRSNMVSRPLIINIMWFWKPKHYHLLRIYLCICNFQHGGLNNAHHPVNTPKCITELWKIWKCPFASAHHPQMSTPCCRVLYLYTHVSLHVWSLHTAGSL